VYKDGRNDGRDQLKLTDKIENTDIVALNWMKYIEILAT